MPQRSLLTNGWIIDGSGSEPQRKDLLIEGRVIAGVGRFPESIEAEKIDCMDLWIAPGFVDAHSHSDLQVLANKPEKMLQGVTCEVVGNCGFSAYPNQHAKELREFANGIFCGDDGWGWRSASDYLLEAHARAKLASVYSLVGHGSLRIAHAGLAQGALDETKVSDMKANLDEALAAGATGLSTGLMYAPGSSAPQIELEELCRVVSKRDKIYCSHIRDYSTNLLAAIDEQLSLARRTGCRLQISHLQAVGKRNWKLNPLALERIEKAKLEGIDVMFDCYPYVAGSTVLTQLLPQWALEGGLPALMKRLADAKQRAGIAQETRDRMVHAWEDIFISGVESASNQEIIGESMAAIATRRREDPMEAVFNLLVQEQGRVNMIQFNQSEENLRATLCHPQSIVISDGFYVKGKPHPRLHGTFPELLGNICREKKWMTLTEAIQKITELPAKRFGMQKRGNLREGFFADIAIFDPKKIASPATYKDPEEAPVGIIGVIREGNALWWNRN